MRAVLTCVGCDDLLALSLPRNRHHFSEVWVATAPGDRATQEVAAAHGARVFATDAWTRGGAHFNKWLGLELCLDAAGREGWLCLMDADVVWPRELPAGWLAGVGRRGPGWLYAPLRRMAAELSDFTPAPPPEAGWGRFPLHGNAGEWAGYSQVFHASDPHLGPPPWHDVGFSHAGVADSLFQRRWPPGRKLRPPWECLHMGPAGANWLGRVSPRTDGAVPEGAAGRLALLRGLIARRRPGPGRFDHERLPGG